MNALTDIGCTEVNANHKENKVDITFDPAVVTLDQIKEEIAEIGFEVV